MADSKLTALTAITSATTDDLFYVVDDPGGAPASKKITFDNLQKSITVIGSASGIATQGDVTIPSSNAFYFGDPNTNGSWRIIPSGTSLVVQRRESGNWVQKGEFTAE